MSELNINKAENELIVSGSDNGLDVSITSNELVIDQDNALSISPVETSLDLSVDDVSLEIAQPTVEILSVAQQGPMGPAGPAGTGTQTEQTIFDQIDEDHGYRGDAALGELTSDPVWKIVKININEDGTPQELSADGDAGFVHVWDDRAGYAY